MAIRNIIKRGDPLLAKKAREVTEFDVRLHTLLDDMLATLHKSEGVGIAAPQVGVIRRVVVIDVGDGLVELINPEITDREGSQTGREGCLSLPGRAGIVTRPERVHVRAQDRHGKPVEYDAEGLFARAVCHELDHLDGILYIDNMDRELTKEEIERDDAEEEA